MTLPPPTSEERGAAFGGSAGVATDLASLLGPRLMPVMDLLATQPEELKGTIISQLREMLDLRATIRQRKKSHARFDKPSLDPTTGEIKRDEEGNSLPFVPNSLRSKCPIKASSLTNNDPEMRKVLDAAESSHALQITLMTQYAKQVSELEIKLRVKQLRRKLFDLIEMIGLSWIIIFEVKNGGELPDAINLDRTELATKLSFDVFAGAATDLCTAVDVANGAELGADYAAYRFYDNGVLEAKMDTADIDALRELIARMSTWLPRLSIRLWEHDDKKDSEAEINAALRAALKPKAQRDKNDDVDAAMDEVDASNPSASLIDLIRKEQKKYGDKQMVMLKRQLRKNYSADDKTKNQSSKAKNGRESKKSSKASEPKKTATSSNPKKDNQGKSEKQKKRKKDKADEPNQKPSKAARKKEGGATRKKESQGGSNKGGKGGGAARR